jgi:hypothetical protein
MRWLRTVSRVTVNSMRGPGPSGGTSRGRCRCWRGPWRWRSRARHRCGGRRTAGGLLTGSRVSACFRVDLWRDGEGLLGAAGLGVRGGPGGSRAGPGPGSSRRGGPADAHAHCTAGSRTPGRKPRGYPRRGSRQFAVAHRPGWPEHRRGIGLFCRHPLERIQHYVHRSPPRHKRRPGCPAGETLHRDFSARPGSPSWPGAR